MESSCLVEVHSDADLVKSLEEILRTDPSLVALVPLAKDAVEVCSGCILPAKNASDVSQVLLVNCVCERRLGPCCQVVNDHRLEGFRYGLHHPRSLLRVCQLVPLSCFLGRGSRGRGVVSCEDFISPLLLFEFGPLSVGDEDGCFRFLSLCVIELHRCFGFRIWPRCTLPTPSLLYRVLESRREWILLKAGLAHSSCVSILHIGVELCCLVTISLCPEIDVC